MGEQLTVGELVVEPERKSVTFFLEGRKGDVATLTGSEVLVLRDLLTDILEEKWPELVFD
jgi:hypothetical protein